MKGFIAYEVSGFGDSGIQRLGLRGTILKPVSPKLGLRIGDLGFRVFGLWFQVVPEHKV